MTNQARAETPEENLREWVATTLNVFLAPADLEASAEAIDTLTQVIECRAKEIAALDAAEQRGAARRGGSAMLADYSKGLRGRITAECPHLSADTVERLVEICEQRGAARGVTWLDIQALERACWKRKWSEVKAARKALEASLGKRPSDPLFVELVIETPQAASSTEEQT